MLRPQTIRRSLIRNLSLLVILTTGMLLALTIVAALRAGHELAQDIVESTINELDQELGEFFGLVEDVALIGNDWSKAGILDPADYESLTALFLPIIERNRQFSSMMVANSDGEEFMLLRDIKNPDVWINRITLPGRWSNQVLYREWNVATGAVEESLRDLDYDPRRRIWYRVAADAPEGSGIHWTRPSIFFETKDPGMTASAKTVVDGTSKTIVVAFDLLLSDISQLTTNLKISEHGLASVLYEEDDSGVLRVIGLPRDSAYSTDAQIRSALVFTPPDEAVPDAEPLLPRVTDIQSVPLKRAVDQWVGEGRHGGGIKFEIEGNNWLANFKSFPIGDNRFWISVAEPEQDVLGSVTKQILAIGLVAFLALLLAIAMATVMARNYGKPLESLAIGSRRIRELDFDTGGKIETNMVEVNQLASDQELMRVTLDSFSKYIPVSLVQELLRRGEAAKIGGSNRTITILFTDIAGFTPISEGLSPGDLAAHMSEYFDDLITIIHKHGGEVNQLLGDGALSFWGAPRDDADHAVHAVDAALTFDRLLARLNQDWAARGKPPLPTRFGLNTGEVMVGNVGSAARIAYAAVGDAVNVASRIEGINKFYGTRILASHFVRDHTGDAFEWRHIDGVRAKGKTEAVELYEPLGRLGEVPADVLAKRDIYENGLHLYRKGEFAEAAALLGADPELRAGDSALDRLYRLSKQFSESAPEGTWDGITTFDAK